MVSNRRRWFGAAVLLSVTAVVATLVSGPAGADQTTMGGNSLRNNWDGAESGLTVDPVSQPDFGQLWSAKLPGTSGASPNQMYAQPLVVGGRVIVATEDNQVAALDEKTGALLWTDASLGAPWTPYPTCGNISPHVGITSTPVYDPATNAIYVVVKTAVAGKPAEATMRIHSLDVATGEERAHWPITIAGTAANNTTVGFNAATANQRAGLLLLGGGVYFATASHCDHGPYVGFVGRVDTATRALTMWASETGASTSEGGIWQSGGGLMSDGDGRIFVATGNGISPAPAAGNRPPGTLAESVVRLAYSTSTKKISAVDFFSPADNDELDQDDADLGSGSPVALPNSFGSKANPHLLVAAGKDGTVWLLNRDNLGGSAQGKDHTDKVVSSTTMNGVWGHAAAFDGGSGAHYVYLLPSESPLQALSVANDNLAVTATGSQALAYGSGSPVVTSDGTDGSGAVVWVTSLTSATKASLLAYRAVPPTSGKWAPIASFPLGAVDKFIQPATSDGKVFVGTADGRVLAFGRPATGAVTASPTDFGTTPVGTPSSATITLTAHRTATITAVSATGPFTLNDTSSVTGTGAAVVDGDTRALAASFDATTPGTSSGTVEVTVQDATGTATYPFSLTGTATQPGLAANPHSVDFGRIAVGQGSKQGITIQNTGTGPVTVTSLTLGTATSSYSIGTGAPKAGDSIDSLHSVVVPVTYLPTKAVAEPATSLVLTVTDAADSTTTYKATVPLTGTGFAGKPRMSFSTTALNFGYVSPGSTATGTFAITNSGQSTLTITKAAQPSAPFFPTPAIPEGQRIAPGDTYVATVTVRPTSAMPARNTYSVTSNDGTGAKVVALSVNTGPWAAALVGPLGCVTLRGRLQVAGTPIVNYGCNGTQAQKFRFGVGGTLTLAYPYGTWCIDVNKGAVTRGSATVLQRCAGYKSAVWQADAAGRLVNVKSHLCLAVLHSSAANNTPLVLDGCSSTPAQQWDPSLLLAARGQISSGLGAVGRYCVTDPGNSARNGTPLTLTGCALAPGQLVAHLGTTLRVGGGCISAPSPFVGSAVWVQTCSGAAAQVWTVGPVNRLYNPASKLCLDVPRGNTASGTPLQLYHCTGSPTQKWNIVG